jgi:hypothetical protein
LFFVSPYPTTGVLRNYGNLFADGQQLPGVPVLSFEFDYSRFKLSDYLSISFAYSLMIFACFLTNSCKLFPSMSYFYQVS